MAKVDQIRAKAAEYFQKGDFAKAVNEYKKVLDLEPGNASTYNFIGDAYVKLSNVGEAVSSYLEAVRGYSNDALYNNAIAVCKKILRVNKEDPEVYKTLGELYIQQGLVNEAITNLLEYAERKIKQGKSDEAFPIYHQIVELNPQNLAVRSKLAEMYLTQKKIPEAIEEFSQLAKAYRNQGRTIEAESLEAKVRGMKGEAAPAQAAPEAEVRPDSIIEELSQQRSEASAESAPELVIDKEPEPPKEEDAAKQDWATNIELGDLLVEIGSTQEALDQYHTAANGYMNDDNVEKSVEVYKKIANLQPLELRSRQKLVEIALQNNQSEALIEAYLGLAECLHRRELREQAAAVYQKVLEIDPVNENALESLSLLLPEMPEGAFEMPGMEIHQESAPSQAAVPDISFSQPAASQFEGQPQAPEPAAWQPEPVQAEAPPALDASQPEPEDTQSEEPQFHGQPAEPPASDDVHWGREIVEGGRQSRVKFSVADEEPAAAPGAQEEFLSLQDILAEFKEGVYQSINQEDFQGHYDLGIAYKEMGLAEEAIAEFQVASKGEKERLKSFEMLGICFLDRGEPKFAIKQLERGLSTPGYSDEDYIGLRYNLAQAYELTGEIPSAIKTLEDIYTTDVNFRDVGQRLQSLRASMAPAAPPAATPRPTPQAPQPAPAVAPAPQARPIPQAPQIQRPAGPPPRPGMQPAAPAPQFQPAPEQPEAESAPKPKPIPSKLKKPEKQRISYV
ncbi:MAG: tetratricopeptide repeat protein [Candidatus Edwardsbacteria bacterium]|nr:tetratricopeptide repeat protein [Candidatus Edwardsbacteria bacterium]MBU1576442.1 tetratricopeptide repeat protein [Candidatus Edwardsbacteria bacterium]MBU2464059.1 tetratricopeptide repeat protein [Candidatus Edwardsbacteria bacterium]MBU2594515.1 tetratricopeptide repeat protein [Candidatus Edwardsbacteria bacterium]